MMAPHEPSAAAAEVSRSRQILLLLFCFALGVRLGYAYDIWRDPEDALYNFHNVQGVPFSDAQSWDAAAEAVAQMQPVPAVWSGRRPFYYWFLAFFYVWTGPSFAVAMTVNLVLSALMAALLADVGRRMFNWPVGLALGVWSVFDIESIVSSIQILTEPLGALLVVWHVALLFRGVQRGGWALLFSGVAFALSNLTRVLILLALPGTACCVWLMWPRGVGTRWRRLWPAAAFVVGAMALLAPYMYRQYRNKGIVSFQDSSAQHFFASTSPEYGQYDHEIERLADDRGLFDVRERYRFYMNEAWKNLRRYPGFFVRNEIRVLWHWTLRSLPTRRPLWLFCTLALCLGLMWAARWRAGGQNLRAGQRLAAAAMLVVCLGVLAAACRYAPQPLVLATSLGAVICGALSGAQRAMALILANLIFFTLAALALAGWDDDRVLILFQWAWTALALAGTAQFFESLWQRIVAPDTATRPGVAPAEARLAAPLLSDAQTLRLCKYSAWFVVLSLAKMTLDGMTLEHRVQRPLSPEQTSEVAAWLCQHKPDLMTPQECSADAEGLKELAARHEAPADNGKLLVMGGRVSRYVHYFPRGIRTHAHWRQFQHRLYERTVFVFDGMDLNNRGWYNYCVIPGKLPPHENDDTFVLVARVSATNDVYQHFVIEVIGLAPLHEPSGRIDYKRGTWSSDPRHLNSLRDLAKPAAGN